VACYKRRDRRGAEDAEKTTKNAVSLRPLRDISFSAVSYVQLKQKETLLNVIKLTKS